VGKVGSDLEAVHPEPPGILLEVKSVSKAFSGHRVLSDVSFRIGRGEFVALLGANGAGKSTLIKILDGVYDADSGEVWFEDKYSRPGERSRKIGVVHQDLGLVDQLSVAENLRLGMSPHYLVWPLLNVYAERRLVRTALETVGLERLDPHLRVGELGLGAKTLVAVAKQLSRGAQIIIADETTSAMSSTEARWLTDRLRSCASAGGAVVMVSHKLGEVVEAANRHIVLRDGRLIADLQRSEITRERIAELIVGQPIEVKGPTGPPQNYSRGTPANTPGGPGARRPARASSSAAGARRAAPVVAGDLLVLDGVSTGVIGPISLGVPSGHIVGVTGLTNSGLYEVALMAAGATSPTSGRVHRQERLRVAFVPPDRDSQGVFGDLTVRENVTLGVGQWTVAGGLLNLMAERRSVELLLHKLKVVPWGLARRQGTLSGGNQQKVLVGRALLRQPQVLVLCEPTRGVDVSTRGQIHEIILEAKAQGVGVLLASTDSEELIVLADTIHVMHEGRIHDVVESMQTNSAGLEALL
jgi:ABC-type sugar transport system ATPase subunit